MRPPDILVFQTHPSTVDGQSHSIFVDYIIPLTIWVLRLLGYSTTAKKCPQLSHLSVDIYAHTLSFDPSAYWLSDNSELGSLLSSRSSRWYSLPFISRVGDLWKSTKIFSKQRYCLSTTFGLFFSKTSLEDFEKCFSESSREDFKKKHLGRACFFQKLPWKILKNIFQNLPGKILKKNT
jgi:hypothetical protein